MPLTRAFAPLALTLLLLAPTAAQEAPPSAPAGFAGTWDSTFGELVIEVHGEAVTGRYALGGGSTLEGRVIGARLVFRYEELNARGDGWFELAADGRTFSGIWRQDGQEEWHEWTGTRRAATAASAGPFDGLFETPRGRVRLLQRGERVEGVYLYDGSTGSLEGQAKDRRLEFSWREGGLTGDGWFEVDAPGTPGGALRGAWRPANSGEEGWNRWEGARVTPKAGVVWLTVLEAYWERGLQEQEYSFGNMLQAYFRRYPRVHVRQRRFDDPASFQREARELAFLAEPVVVVIASHGKDGALAPRAGAVPADEVGQALRWTPTLQLVHFSSCEMMAGDAATRVQAGLGRRAPISGYEVSVDWSASALLEMLYLDLIAGRGIPVARAAEMVRRELRFAGDEGGASPLGACRFRLVE